MKIKHNTVIILLLLALTTLTAKAHLIPIGEVTFTGNFTLNHLYNFNDTSAQPFGSLSNQTVVGATGLFSPFIGAGNVLAGQALWSNSGNLPLFTISGFTYLTSDILITGADFVGRWVGGFGSLTGNGLEPNPDVFVSWNFTAPPYDISNFPEDITGPINFQFLAFIEDHRVPDGGNTLLMLLGGLATLGYLKKL